MTAEQIAEKIAEHIEAAKDEPVKTWWLSFVQEDRPEGDRFVGVVLVDACRSFDEAFLRASMAGANPHGQVVGYGFERGDVPDDQYLAMSLLPRLTILTKTDLLQSGIVF
jgi:hypothetical protein